MTIRIGANPIGWTNDDLQEVAGDTPLETCLAEAMEAGVVSLKKGHMMPSDGAALKDKLAELGLSFVGGWRSTELLRRSAKDEFEAARQHIAMGKGAGADIVIARRRRTASTATGRNRCLSGRHKDDWVAYSTKMTEFAQRIADEGLTSAKRQEEGYLELSSRLPAFAIGYTRRSRAYQKYEVGNVEQVVMRYFEDPKDRETNLRNGGARNDASRNSRPNVAEAEFQDWAHHAAEDDRRRISDDPRRQLARERVHGFESHLRRPMDMSSRRFQA